MALSGDLGNTQNLVEIEDIRGGTIVMKGGALRQVLISGGTNFALKSETEQNIITEAYQNFLNGINFPLQIIVHSRKINIERYLEKLDERRAEEPSALLQDQIFEYQEFIRGFIKDNPIMTKTFLVVIPYVPATLAATKEHLTSALPPLPFFGGKKKEGQKKQETDQSREAAFQEALLQLKQRVNQVVQGLFAVGLDAMPLNDEQLVELLYNFYNPETVERGSVDLAAKK